MLCQSYKFFSSMCCIVLRLYNVNVEKIHLQKFDEYNNYLGTVMFYIERHYT